jgi:pimeloyl-ACP methyl ester carboxylesterase
MERLNHSRSGAGEPLVLVHGLGASIATWAPVIPALERERDVLAVDLPGFGESAPLPDGTEPTVPALADALERELDAVGFESAHLVGSSLGGWLALELARRGRARSVVAISPAGMWTEKERAWADRFLRTQLRAAQLFAPHAGLLRNPVVRTLLLGGVMARPWRASPDDVIYGIGALARSRFMETHEAMIRDRAGGLDEVRCPVLILWGTRDYLLPPRQAQRFARAIAGAELRELRGLGHVPTADDPDLIARAILDFTARTGRAQSSATK